MTLYDPMKTLRGSTSLDKQFTGQYRWLFRYLGALILIVLAFATAAVVYFDKRQVEALSSKLITRTAATIAEQVWSFFETADSNLRIAIEQLQLSQSHQTSHGCLGLWQLRQSKR